MKLKISLFFTLLAVAICANAQSIENSWPALPDAISKEASLPAALAKKMAIVENEKRAKICTSQRRTTSQTQGISNNYSKYVTDNGGAITMRCNPKDNYKLLKPLMRIINSSHGHEMIKSGQTKEFNKKKDYLQNVYLDSNNRIVVLNHQNHPCKMSDFTFSYDKKYFQMDGNKLILNMNAFDVLNKDCPIRHEIEITHPASGLHYKYKLELYFRSGMNKADTNAAYALCELSSEVPSLPDMALLLDLDSKEMQVVHLPFTLTADGADGYDGRDGDCGLNGTNAVSYTDKDGKTHTIPGTCGKPGQDGQDGRDGGNGGTFLLCISEQMYQHNALNDIVLTIDAGKGGKGGKAGLGGKNGKGSGCAEGQRAASGKDGRDGKDGKRGDFLFVVADTESFFQKVFE